MKQAMKAAKAKKVIKAMKGGAAMKSAAMKAMKAVSKVATGVRAKFSVFSGHKEKTVGGLTKDKLVKNKEGKIVSKSMSANAKKAYASSALKQWAVALKAARKALGLTGFVPMGGKTAAGKALYAKAKSLMSS